MKTFFCDLHVHSCLSPCAEDEMTPANIAAMAAQNGLSMVALTDHNTCGNCAAFLSACRNNGILGIPGMELTTSEEIHLVCLFSDLENALRFEKRIPRHRIKNRPEIFGRQILLDAYETVLGEEPNLLLTATDLSVEEAVVQVESCAGCALPAHIDRSANGIVSILGTVPHDIGFRAFELYDERNEAEYRAHYDLQNYMMVCSSDAHNLCDIQGRSFAVQLPGYESEREIRTALICRLRGETL